MRIAVAIDLAPTASYHRATIDAIGHAAGALGCAVDVDVRNTDAAGFDDLSGVDGLVIGPGSPYRDEPAVWNLVRAAREGGLPLVGT